MQAEESKPERRKRRLAAATAQATPCRKRAQLAASLAVRAVSTTVALRQFGLVLRLSVDLYACSFGAFECATHGRDIKCRPTARRQAVRLDEMRLL